MPATLNQAFPETIPEFLRARAEQSPDKVAYCHFIESEGWIETAWADFYAQVRQIAAALESWGLKTGDRLGIMIPTCREWELVEKAALLLGAVVVGIEPHASWEHKQLIINQAGVTALVVKNKEQLALLGEATRARIRLVVLLEGPGDIHANEVPWGELQEVSRQINSPQPAGSDPATLIFTSGTTGAPKGILYTHRQCMLACQSLLEVYGDFGEEDNVICWMPLANLFQRIMNLCAIGTGSTVYLVEDPPQVMDYVGSVKPAVFIGVPRFYEKLFDGIRVGVEAMPALQQKLVNWALTVARRHSSHVREVRPRSLSLRLGYAVAEALVLKRLRGVMGGRVKYMISGSAPCPTQILEFFDSIGLPLLEAYGLSENIVPVCANHPGDYRLGSVGKPLALNEVKLAEDGEVLVRGEGMFQGYCGSNDTAPAFSREGFYTSSDLGYFDDDGFLYLKGRKSEIIKTSTGRRIALNRIENVLRQIDWVDQVVVFGSGRKSLVALVTLDQERRPGVKGPQSAKPGDEGEEIAPEWTPLLAREIRDIGEELAPYERISGCIVCDQPFSMETGEMTPNLKYRRAVIEEHHKNSIDRLYEKIGRREGGKQDYTQELPVIICQ